MGFPAPLLRRVRFASLLRAAGSLPPPTAASFRSLLPRFGGRVPMVAALSLPPHNRGSLAGARAPPPLLRRVRRREWFSCCSWLLLSASRCARYCRGSRAARLAALFVCVFLLPLLGVSCCSWVPALGSVGIGLVCPFPALSRRLVRWRVAGRPPLLGFLRLLPPPLPLFGSVGWASLPSVGSVGAPSCASPSAQRFAPSGLFLSRCRGGG